MLSLSLSLYARVRNSKRPRAKITRGFSTEESVECDFLAREREREGELTIFRDERESCNFPSHAAAPRSTGANAEQENTTVFVTLVVVLVSDCFLTRLMWYLTR